MTVLGKLCALLAIKAVSFDSAGRAIEMESGRPGWNDAMNGLPGLFGSSTCEAVETLRLAKWLLKTLPQMPNTELPLEVAALIEEVIKELKKKYGQGKRVFKMAPIHHHFELLGWAEPKIVVRFYIIGIILAIVTLVSFKIR